MATANTIKTLTNDTALVGSQVTIKGWLRSKRDSKAGISFLAVHDGTCFDSLQAVVPNTLDNYESEVLGLTTGCSVEVTGELVESQGKGQNVEIQATGVTVVGLVDDPEGYPIAKKRHTFEYLRTQAHLRTRTNTFGAITRVRHVLARAIHEFFHRENFYWVNTPIITASDCEGAGELFRVSTLDFANLPRNPMARSITAKTSSAVRRSSLYRASSQSSHTAYRWARYTFGPTFRAENSHTSRHLAEFWMVEPEIAFADLNDNADLAERLLRHVIAEVLEHCHDDMAFFQQHIDNTVMERLQGIVDSSFERMTYSEAINILENCGETFEYPVNWGIDMASEHERFLAEKHVGRPIVVTDYPKEIKAFYMRLNDDGKTVAAMDVLAPGIGEIIGGSQREERLDILDSRMDEQLKADLWWYRDLRRYGTVPHAGFGLGFERLLAYVTGMENVRDVIPFPRTPGNAHF